MNDEDIYSRSVNLHRELKGKIEIKSKVRLETSDDLSMAYTPGVAQVSREIATDHTKAYELTMKHNSIAIVSDGSAVLGLGNIGPFGAIPVMEGKAVLFKEFAGIDAYPICVDTQNTYEIISLVKNIAPSFAGVNLEDIAAPRCFEIEEALQNIGIPVFHDDQHGTAIVLLAALINASKLAGKTMQELVVVVNGAGAAGTAIAQLLRCVGQDKTVCEPVKEIFVLDTKGIISMDRPDLANDVHKMKLASITNRSRKSGGLKEAMLGADVFIGVSSGGILDKELISTMNTKPIIFAMANPTPEIMPDDAYSGGAFIVGTGRSDFPNQVNNVLAFPGIFRGAIDAHAKVITNSMKIGAAFALASCVDNPTPDHILPHALDRSVADRVASAVQGVYKRESEIIG